MASLCAALVLTACAPKSPVAVPAASGPTISARPPVAPTKEHPYVVQINYPAPGAKLQGKDLLVTVTVQGFQIVDKLGQKAKKGEGHIHYYLDVDKIPTTPGKPAITDDASTYHAVATTSYTWKDVAPGKHKLAVQLVNNDHTPLEPFATDKIKVTLKP
jgi:hypothetical protein